MYKIILYTVFVLLNIKLALSWDCPENEAEFVARIKDANFTKSIPDADGQIKEYKKIYKQAQQHGICSQGAIADLGQMLERALGYIYDNMSKESRVLYAREFDLFAHEAFEHLTDLTIYKLRIHCLRVSTLLSHAKSFDGALDSKLLRSSYSKVLKVIDVLEEKIDGWLSLDFYSFLLRDLKSYSMLYDAIIFADELSPEQFIHALLDDHDMPISLAMFAAKDDICPSHGGIFRTPTAILYHDFVHCSFMHEKFVKFEYDTFKFFRTILHHQDCSANDIKLLFLMTHEFPVATAQLCTEKAFHSFTQTLFQALEPSDGYVVPRNIHALDQYLGFQPVEYRIFYISPATIRVKYVSADSQERYVDYNISYEQQQGEDSYYRTVTGLTLNAPAGKNYPFIAEVAAQISEVFVNKCTISEQLIEKMRVDGYNMLGEILAEDIVVEQIFKPQVMQGKLQHYRKRWLAMTPGFKPFLWQS